MTTITFSSDNGGFFESAVFDANGDVSLDIVSATSTTVVLFNPSTGLTTTITGSNFAFAGPPGDEVPISGTVNSIVVTDGMTPVGSITGVSWGLIDFSLALDGLSSDNPTALINLINADGPITVNADNGGRIQMDQLFGETREEAVSFLAQLTQPITVNGGDLNDEIMVGTSANDVFNIGGSPVDGGFDLLFGSAGSDTYNFAGFSGTAFAGLEYRFVSGSITVNINGTAGTGSVTKSTGTDTLNDVDDAIGDADGLFIVGTASADTFTIENTSGQWIGFETGEGNDTLNLTVGGLIRLDYRYATNGIVADLGAGTIIGNGNTDSVTWTGTGRLEIRASDAADELTGSALNESFITEQGNDTVDGGDGFDRIRYDRSGVSDLTVDLGHGFATVTWDGFMFTQTLSNLEHVRGTRDGNDSILGGTANELLETYAGNDTVSGAAGNDTIRTGTGNDSIVGGAGNDSLEGDVGFDTIRGGGDNDTIYGGAGADSLYGDDGNDRILGGQGFDQLFGGDGDDTLLSGETADRVFGGEGNDSILGGTNFGITVDGLWGEGGDDTILGEGGFDLLDGGDGNDSLDGGNQADNLFGRDGNDTLLGGQGLDRLFGGNDDDLAYGGTGNDGLFGDFGNDTLYGEDGNDRFFGASGNDLIYGGADNDTINGGSGFDTIHGGTGDDIMFGRFNADRFVFEDGHGNDTIGDFNALNNFERIDFSGLSTINSLADLNLGSATLGAATQVGGDVVIDTGSGNSITLTGVSLADLDGFDFVF